MTTETLRDAHAWARHGVPRRFPIFQFPNAPLLVAIAAWAVARALDGRAADYADGVHLAALTVWAYEEVSDGANWFRRLLGVAGLAYVVVRIAGLR